MKYIRIGKIVNTHGLKGEVRILSDFKYKNKIFKNGFKIYIGNNKVEEEIVTYRVHKQFDMITMMGYTNINDILKYKGQYVFVNKYDIKLLDGEYLDEDLLNLSVICDNVVIGKVNRIEKYPHQDIIVVKDNDKKYLIPNVSAFIKKIDLENKIMVIKNIKGLIE